MPKVWNIGNTTVRNAKRIENALRVFLSEGFSGNAKGSVAESRLHQKLKEQQVLDFEGDPSDWNGRKWRAAFYQLGFISYEKYKIEDRTLSVEELFASFGQAQITMPYELTGAGKRLINAESVPEIEDIYTRQFCCYELPNTLEGGFPEGRLKPFIFLTQVLFELQQKNMRGLNNFETGLFIQPFQDHTADLVTKTIEKIIQFREESELCKNAGQRKAHRDKYLKALEEQSGINPLSVVRDYSDTTFRYFSLSGLFMYEENSITIRSNKIEFVRELLKSEPNFLFSEDPLTYFKHFYNNTYPLPIDNKEFAIKEVQLLKEEVRDKSNALFETVEKAVSSQDLTTLQSVRHKLIEYNRSEREEDYAKEQQSEDAINDVLRYLKTLNAELVEDKPTIDDRPAFLEWAVWRSFLAINEIKSKIHETRRFPVDEDFMPRNTAPGGGSDLIFEFEGFVLVIEVTLTISHRQMAVESEPVRRHTVKYKEQYPDKEIYCLFIAPEIDNNVAENFRIGVWYNGDDEQFVNIVPMRLGDFNKTIAALLTKRYRNDDYRTLLDRCLVSRNVRAPQWKKSIANEVNEWVKRVSSKN